MVIQRLIGSVFQGLPGLFSQALFFRYPYWTRVFRSSHWLYWSRGLLRYGKILAISVLVLYLLKPEFLNQALPGWRHSLGYVVLLTAGAALLFNLFRFSGVILASSLWILIICLIGKEVLNPSPEKPAFTTQSTVISRAHHNSTRNHMGGIKTARALEKRADLRTLEGNWFETRTFWDRINPLKIAGNLFGRVFDWWSTRLRVVSTPLEEKLASRYSQAAQTMEQAKNDLDLAAGRAKAMLAWEPTPELANSGLPGEVYYPPAARRGFHNRVLSKIAGD